MKTKYVDKKGKTLMESEEPNPHLGASFLHTDGTRYQVIMIEVENQIFIATCDIIKNFDDDNKKI